MQVSTQTRFAEAVRGQAARLTAAERRLVETVLTEPRQAALGTATDLARGVGVHEATVSRLARKLGFDSYGAFRQSLRDAFIPSQETATRLSRAVEGAEAGGVLATLVAEELAGLAAVAAHVSEADIAAVAARLMAARRVHVFGRGNAEVLAHLMVRRLRRFGRDVRHLDGDGRDLAERALLIGEGDVVLVYAFRRQPPHYAPLAARAKAVGAATVVVSGRSGHLLLPAPDVLLSAPRSGDPEAFQTLTVPMAISNAIVIAAARADPTALRSLDALGSLIEAFE